MKKKSNKSIIRNLIFFSLLIALTLWILLKDQNMGEIVEILKNVKLEFVAIGILCMALYYILEAINLGRTLKVLEEKSSFLKNVKYVLIGSFFSGITPAASGGQPMQIYYMYKEDIQVAHSTLALLINLTSMQITTIGLALISLLFNYQYLNLALVIFFIIGIMLNSSALTLLVIGICSERLSRGLINFAIKVLKFFRVKNIEDKKEKLEKELEKYQYSAKYIKANKSLMIKILITTIIEYLIYYSISYWTYRAFGFNESNIIEIITMQSVLFATVSGIPSPGAVGVSEGAFIEIYKHIYPTNMINSATLLNRGINFYLFILINAIVVVVNGIRIKNNRRVSE